MAQVIDHLCSKHEALSSNLSSNKKIKKIRNEDSLNTVPQTLQYGQFWMDEKDYLNMKR
jgi:hypothetical protein